jgi:hypothetical protein
MVALLELRILPGLLSAARFGEMRDLPQSDDVVQVPVVHQVGSNRKLRLAPGRPLIIALCSQACPSKDPSNSNLVQFNSRALVPISFPSVDDGQSLTAIGKPGSVAHPQLFLFVKISKAVGSHYISPTPTLLKLTLFSLQT